MTLVVIRNFLKLQTECEVIYMNQNIKHQSFSDVNLSDQFFSTLKSDYPKFENWFNSHLDRDAYVLYDDYGKIQGFLHLKNESGVINDVRPEIKATKILKIATFKVEAHGTKMGEQFIKIIMDNAIKEQADLCYVTIFPKHKNLIKLVNDFGFEEYGEKGDIFNPEKVYVKDMKKTIGDLNKDYPLIRRNGTNKYLLSIYPQYHSVMFPDSILTTENKNIITDISHTNSIHKVYVCTMGVDVLNYGDIIVLYRTGENNRSAEYSSVATSICTVEEVKKQSDFKTFNDFFNYANQYSVFDRSDLYYWYQRGGCKAIKMTYNVALSKRIVRHDLIETIGMDRNAYWGFMPITDKQFDDIIYYGKVNPQIII